jgi:flagella basal body P-ring formation protein FlgA
MNLVRLAAAGVLFAFTANAAAQQPVLAVSLDSALDPMLAPAPASTPTLRADILVSSEVVRIGDLVDNAGAAARIAVFRAPDIGTTGSVPAARVIAALRGRNIIGVDTRGITEVTVTRAGRAIGTQELQTHIAQILAERYSLRNADELGITFDRDIRTIQVDPTQEHALQATRAAYDPRSGRFDVSFAVGADAGRTLLRVTGRAVETAEVVVVTRAIARGDVLRDADLAVRRRPKSEVTADTYANLRDAIGYALRQDVKAGQIVRRAELVKPQLVHRNEPVIIMFEQPGMILTLRGKALESGAEGETVNVMNLQSKRTLQGFVTGPNEVTIPSSAPRVQASAKADVKTDIAAMDRPGARP